jgi:uncharacterized protein YjeT (DUF2065 family)
MHWVLIVCGVLTTTMIFPMIAPRLAFKYIFGEVANGPLGDLLTRNWGQMIFATGLLLIYAAYHEEARLPILMFASFTKLTFASLVISNGGRYLRKRAIQVAGGDLVMVGLFVWYLLAV